MTDPAARQLEGRMFLYERPELLSLASHATLGLSPAPRPYGFAESIRIAPLVTAEFASAQKDFPVVFSDGEIPAPVAVLGVVEDVNLYVDENGHWEQRRYVPSYIRCHPICLAEGPNEQHAVVIDRGAATVSDTPAEPFFDGSKLSASMQSRVDFSSAYAAEKRKTISFCRRLKELDLFVGQQVTHRRREQDGEPTVGAYVAVNVEKLGKLDSTTLGSLHADGSLAAIYAHVFSLENWNRLFDRRVKRQAAGREVAGQRGLQNTP
ncbi:MAG: SapC family protein [Woeseiaceae bacterium]